MADTADLEDPEYLEGLVLMDGMVFKDLLVEMVSLGGLAPLRALRALPAMVGLGAREEGGNG